MATLRKDYRRIIAVGTTDQQKMSTCEPSYEQPPRVHVDGSRVLLMKRMMPRQEQDSPFEPMLATPADESAKPIGQTLVSSTRPAIEPHSK